MKSLFRVILFFFVIPPSCCLPGFLLSCQQKKQPAITSEKKDTISSSLSNMVYQKIDSAKKILKDGQLVTRSSDNFESMVVQNFSRRERNYSHSGLLFKENGSFVVYHCLEGEENPSGICKREPFDSFIDPKKKTGFGVFQYQLSKMETGQLHTMVKKYFTSKIPFDISFNLQTDDSLYCSEMIYKALKQATSNRIKLPSSYIENFRPKIMGYKTNHLFFKKFEFIGIDDLYLNPFCKEIIRVKY